MKKLEARKTALEGVTQLKAKFERAKAKKLEMGKRASTARAEAARLRLLADEEEAKALKLEEGMQVTDKAISSAGAQALQEAKQLALTKAKAAKWSTLVSKAQKEKSSTKIKWESLKS